MESEEKVKSLSVSIDRSAAEVYEFLCAPENFPKWASCEAVRFSERNSRGVLDHAVRLPGGGTHYVPLRVVATGRGCELVLTLFPRPEISQEKFMRDLQAAKHLLERNE